MHNSMINRFYPIVLTKCFIVSHHSGVSHSCDGMTWSLRGPAWCWWQSADLVVLYCLVSCDLFHQASLCHCNPGPSGTLPLPCCLNWYEHWSFLLCGKPSVVGRNWLSNIGDAGASKSWSQLYCCLTSISNARSLTWSGCSWCSTLFQWSTVSTHILV